MCQVKTRDCIKHQYDSFKLNYAKLLESLEYHNKNIELEIIIGLLLKAF